MAAVEVSPAKITNPEKWLWSVPWDNMGNSPNELGSLAPEKKVRVNTAAARMNADLQLIRKNAAQNGGQRVPEWYYRRGREMADYIMDTAAFSGEDRKNTGITIAEESFVLDREKARTYYDVNVSAQIFEPVTRVMPRFKWDVKHYLINKVRDVAKFSRHFASPGFIQLATSSQVDTGTGWYCGYQIDRWTLLENRGELFDIQYETMLEAAYQMGRLANEHILTGTTLEHGGTDDMGESMSLKGFANHASLQTFTISTLTTFFNIYKGLKSGLQDLRKVWATDNTILITSGGIPSQAEVNFATYEARNELDEIQKRMVGPDKRIKQWWISDYITGAAISTSTQAALLLKLDPRLMSRLIILPLQILPSEKKNWKDDISEVMLAADILRYKKYDTTENAFPATISSSLTTTDLGEITSGRFM